MSKFYLGEGMQFSVFSEEKCELGEGPLWFNERNSLFWVDINQKLVFEKSIDSSNECYDNVWGFLETPSALVRLNKKDSFLGVVTDKGFFALDLISGEKNLLVDYTLEDKIRTNDAGVGPDGKLWIGTMLREPIAPKGNIISIDNNGAAERQAQHIYIPNTFCWNPAGEYFYLTDSHSQIIYRFPFPSNFSEFRDFIWKISEEKGVTFDGGAVDQSGSLWIAKWGGSCIEKLSALGNLESSHSLPVQQPSSCCFGGDNNQLLFVTSAMEGLTDQQKNNSPHAGKVFVMKCDTAGVYLPGFGINVPR